MSDNPLKPPIFLSPPHLGGQELDFLRDALESNWVAPAGPQLQAMEREFAQFVGMNHALALNSGTAALHLALLQAGVGPGDDVILPTLTFAASAHAVSYCGATPVFVDCRETDWNLDPARVVEAVQARRKLGKTVRVVIAVDLYGVCADYRSLREICDAHGLLLVEDAAGALGSSYGGKPAGAWGDLSIISLNGNKIITCGGGGLLFSQKADWIEDARQLSQQARALGPHFHHREVGFNYRLSNLLAAVGRAQFPLLPARIVARRAVHQRYRNALADAAGFCFMPLGEGKSSWNAWLTTLQINEEVFGTSALQVCDRLAQVGVEARPLCKPMHLQPAYLTAPRFGGKCAETIAAQGLALPSGSALTPSEQDRIIAEMLT